MFFWSLALLGLGWVSDEERSVGKSEGEIGRDRTSSGIIKRERAGKRKREREPMERDKG